MGTGECIFFYAKENEIHVLGTCIFCTYENHISS
jgi:hypothetical protein